MTLIQFRRGTAAAWTAANPTLASGEPGQESDTGLRKVGDGTTAWTALAYDGAKGLTTGSTTGGTPTASTDTLFGLVGGVLRRALVGSWLDDWTGGATGAVYRTLGAKAGEVPSVKDFGAKGDGKVVTGTASIASGAAALTLTGATFAAGDIGKAITVPGAGTAGASLTTTIAGVTDATHVTLGANAATTLSAVAGTTVRYGTDDTAAIQAAFDWCRTNRLPVLVPAGTYKTTSPLWLTRTAFEGLSVRGDGRRYDAGGGSAQAETMIDASGVLAAPALAVQFGRGVVLRDLAVVGPNTAPAAVSEPTNTAATWVTTGVRDSRYSPQCAVCIDPLSGSTPPDGGYPGLSYSGASEGSADVRIERVTLLNHVVGVMIAPANVAVQGDQVNVTDCQIQDVRVGVACGHGQSNALFVQNTNIGPAQYCLSGLTYGVQLGPPPTVVGGQMGPSYAFMAFSAAVKGGSATGVAMESVKTLGWWGITGANAALDFSFVGCRFATRGAWKRPPTYFDNEGPAVLVGCSLVDGDSNPDVVNFGGAGALTLIGCSIAVAEAQQPKVAMVYDMAYNKPVTLQDVRLHDGSAVVHLHTTQPRPVLHPHRVSTWWGLQGCPDGFWRYQYQPGGSDTYVTLAGASAWSYNVGAGTAQCTMSPTTDIRVGDIVVATFLTNSPSSVPYFGPGLKITSIVGTTVGLTMPFDPALYDTTWQPSSLTVFAPEWAPGTALTFNTTSGGTSLASVSPTDVLKDGDWVKGAGLAANARVVSGGGTATVTLNRAATATATGVRGYYGRLVPVSFDTANAV